MRASRHNGRSGSHGAYNPKHNDREFDLNKSEEIKKKLTKNNLYWDCITRQVVRHDERTEETPSFTEVEKGFCVLSNYLHLLKRWKTEYAPKDENSEWHPYFCEALKETDHV